MLPVWQSPRDIATAAGFAVNAHAARKDMIIMTRTKSLGSVILHFKDDDANCAPIKLTTYASNRIETTVSSNRSME